MNEKQNCEDSQSSPILSAVFYSQNIPLHNSSFWWCIDPRMNWYSNPETTEDTKNMVTEAPKMGTKHHDLNVQHE